MLPQALGEIISEEFLNFCLTFQKLSEFKITTMVDGKPVVYIACNTWMVTS